MRVRQLLAQIALISITIFGSAMTMYGNEETAPADNIKYSFTVSMDNPNTHYYHVEMVCVQQDEDFIDFKMPVWTPGYYAIQNLPKNVVGFKATNGGGEPLDFYKISKNIWHVTTTGEETLVISYDVYANELAVFASYLDRVKGFISPTGVFMFPDGQIDQPSSVHFKLYKDWKSITTGLDKIPGKANTFYAANFDVLYDCPVLLGNHEELEFEVKGIPHVLTFSKKDTLDKTVFINDLTKMIESATTLMGKIPYTHYAFLTLGSPGGGLEHSNSCALSCRGSVADTTDRKEYKRWLTFVTHEYFHLYNVKSIRPKALGPFNYDVENYTDLLWLSEGGTVYYEYIILNRAGLFSREECFEGFSKSIRGYKERPGHLVQSVGLSSFDAWIHYFDPSGDERNNAISYYDKGCAVSLILDLRIREVTNGQKSLDDAMRGLYNKYFLELKRGFTDQELQNMCEAVAGTSLNDVFDYVSSVESIDFPRYLSPAGLNIDTTSSSTGKPFLGAEINSDENSCWFSNVQRNSPAWKAGLGNQLHLVQVEGLKASSAKCDSILATKLPGDTLGLKIEIDEDFFDVNVMLSEKKERTFKIEEKATISDAEKKILDLWLK